MSISLLPFISFLPVSAGCACFILIFFKDWHPFMVHLKFICIKSLTSINKQCAGIITNKSCSFSIFRWYHPPFCSWHPVMALAAWHLQLQLFMWVLLNLMNFGGLDFLFFILFSFYHLETISVFVYSFNFFSSYHVCLFYSLL